MKIEKKTDSYNARRYGKPWIAKVTFPTPKGEMEWGTWIGEIDGGSGSDGLLVIEAQPGDIIAAGQKDHRGNGGDTNYYVVGNDGKRHSLSNRADAYAEYQAQQAKKQQPAPVDSMDELASYAV